MPANDDKFYAGHRERLRQKFLNGQSTESELLETLLGYAIPRRDLRPLARALLREFGNIPRVLTAPIETLEQFPGIGHNTAVFLKLVHEMTSMDYKFALGSKPVFHDPQLLYAFCKNLLMDKPIEEFHVLCLNKNYQLLADQLHSTGTVNASSAYPREIVHRALNVHARYIVLLHNHPSGDPAFSSQDVKLTEHVLDALRGLDMELYDHLLVTAGRIISMKETLLLK